jgi:hypothetical protein
MKITAVYIYIYTKRSNYMKEQTLLNIVKIKKIKGLIKRRKIHPRIISIDLSG